MKRAALLLILCSSLASAQQPAPSTAERVPAPTYSDLYCAGFITNQAIPRSDYIVADTESPNETEFHQGNLVFLQGGSYTEGARFSVLRALRDPNQNPAFHGQAGAISSLGVPYAELGRLRVTAVRGKIAIGEVEFSCAAMAAGDFVVPFQEKAPVTFRSHVPFQRFPAGESSVTGRIVMAKDFDYVVGTGQKVYISAGADKGVKVGDYFRALRNYDPHHMTEIDSLSYKQRTREDTQKYRASVHSAYAELPKEAVAQMIVLNVTPTSSTAMITYALENVNVGDTVELEPGGSH